MSEDIDTQRLGNMVTRRLTDDEVRELFLSPMTSTTETNAAIALRFEVARARREEERLRLALADATGEAEDQGEAARTNPARLHAAESERDAQTALACDLGAKLAEAEAKLSLLTLAASAPEPGTSFLAGVSRLLNDGDKRETYDEVWADRDRLRERLDQFEAAGFPNVATVLDRLPPPPADAAKEAACRWCNGTGDEIVEQGDSYIVSKPCRCGCHCPASHSPAPAPSAKETR